MDAALTRTVPTGPTLIPNPKLRLREQQYAFPAAQRSLDPQTGVERRHHLKEDSLRSV